MTLGDAPRNTAGSISATQLKEMLEKRSVLTLDVRTEEEYVSETGHVPGALLIPLQELQVRVGELEAHRGETIVAYCHTQSRSAMAARYLASVGFHAVYMIGGIISWLRSGYDVETGESE